MRHEWLAASQLRDRCDAVSAAFNAIGRKTHRHNMLMDDAFRAVLRACFMSASSGETAVARRFVIDVVKSRRVSATALVALLHDEIQRTVPMLQAVCEFVMELAAVTMDARLLVSLANGDPRLVPLLLEAVIRGRDEGLRETVGRFVLGDPDLVVAASLCEETHYKTARCRLLGWLVTHTSLTVDSCLQQRLLLLYLRWNARKLCVMELAHLSELPARFASLQSWSTEASHFRLFVAFLETLCGAAVLCRVASDSLLRMLAIWTNVRERRPDLPDEVDFWLASLVLLGVRDVAYVDGVFRMLARWKQFAGLGKVLCGEVIFSVDGNVELEGLLRDAYGAKFESAPIGRIPPAASISAEFGLMAALGYEAYREGKRVVSRAEEGYFARLNLARWLNHPTHVASSIASLLGNGDLFQVLFVSLHHLWNAGEIESVAVAEGFVALLGPIVGETRDERTFRLSWIVDFFEESLDERLLAAVLPALAAAVTSADNVLFAFVQQKLTTLASRCLHESGTFAQLALVASLLALVDSSQSRQSRLNFLVATALGFVTNVLSGAVRRTDARALALVFRLAMQLADVAVIDPRMFWTRFVSSFVLGETGAVRSATVRSAIARFVSAFRFIPLDKEGKVDGVKEAGIVWLLGQLEVESDSAVLEAIFDSLASLDVASVRAVAGREAPDSIEQKHSLIPQTVLNPERLWLVSGRLDGNVPASWERMWARLIDEEVASMPRTLFIGSTRGTSRSETCARSSETRITRNKPIVHPSLSVALLAEKFDEADVSDEAAVARTLKQVLLPIVPTISQLVWFVRPHLGRAMTAAGSELLSRIDDQRLLKQLANYEMLLQALKGPATPQHACAVLLVVSAVLVFLHAASQLAEKTLREGWIAQLATGGTGDFSVFAGNDDFVAAVFVSLGMFAGVSAEIDDVIVSVGKRLVTDHAKRDSVALFSAIECVARIDSHDAASALQGTVLDEGCSGKRRLAAGLAIVRHQRRGRECDEFAVATLARAAEAERVADGAAVLAAMLLAPDAALPQVERVLARHSLAEPPEFKGVLTAVAGRVNATALEEKHRSRALEAASIPAALKFDAILGYAVSRGFSLVRLETRDVAWIDSLETALSTTSDARSQALIQTVALLGRAAQGESELRLVDSALGCARFDRDSWLRFVAEQMRVQTGLCLRILTRCALLPRVEWQLPSASRESFAFALKHVIATTPVTKVPHCSPPLMAHFRTSLLDYVAHAQSSELQPQIARIVEVVMTQLGGEDMRLLLCGMLALLRRERLVILFEELYAQLASVACVLAVEDAAELARHLVEIGMEIDASLVRVVLPFVARHAVPREQLPLAVALVEADVSAVAGHLQAIRSCRAEEQSQLLAILATQLRGLDDWKRLQALLATLEVMAVAETDGDYVARLAELFVAVISGAGGDGRQLSGELLHLLRDIDNATVSRFKSRVRNVQTHFPSLVAQTLDSVLVQLEYVQKEF